MDDRGAQRDLARRVRTARMEAFSDGVFAIAITLLILEIGVPSGSGQSLLHVIAGQWPSYLAYLVSFATIGAVWSAHAVITAHISHATSMLLRLNLLLLLTVSFLPYPTRLVTEYIGKEEPERVAVTFYGTCLFACAALVLGLWLYVLSAGLLRPDAAQEDVRILTHQLTPSLAGYIAMIALGLFRPFLAILGYLALAVLILVPLRFRRRPRTGTGPNGTP
jgi:uncharacterized membrane protein